MTTEILKLDEIVSSQAQKEIAHNNALRQIEAWTRALSMTTTTPPGTPAAGDTYIVAPGATGAWAGQDGKLAHYYGGSWKFRVPVKGVRTFVLDEGAAGAEYVFDNTAAWVANGGDASEDIAAAIAAHAAEADPHPQYVTAAEGAAASQAAVTAHENAADPHAQYQKESEKGAANGYAGLDANGKVPTAQLPASSGGGSSAGVADTVPSLSSFSWVNQGGAAATQQPFGISMNAPNTTNDNLRCLVTPISFTNYTITARLRIAMLTNNYVCGGLAIYNSGTGKVSTFGPCARDNILFYTGIGWNSATSYQGDWGGSWRLAMPIEWYRWRFAADGYFYVEISSDGAEWMTVQRYARDVIITPTHAGVYVNANNQSNFGMMLSLFSWSVTEQ